MRKRKGKTKASDGVEVIIDEEFRRKFSEYCLMDDFYMSVFFKDNLVGAQCVLRVILEKPDLKVESVKVQEGLFSVIGRRAVLDVLATDSDGTMYDIEVQRVADGADPLRARYYSGIIDANALPAGASYSELREKYVIFITETDVLKGGLPIYHIGRTIAETGLAFNDGEHIVYVNGSRRDAGTALGRLMQDFFCRSADGMHYEELRKRTKELKESKEVGKMSDVIRELVEKGIEQGIEQGMEKGMEAAKADAACRMIGKGLDIEMISECLDLPVDYVRSIAKAAN